jgi:hypothetical protein
MKIENENYLQSRFARSESIVSRKIADEYLLVPICRSAADVQSIYTMNEVATRIWELLDGSKRLCEIRDVLVREFDVAEDEAEGDLIELIRQLESVGAVERI